MPRLLLCAMLTLTLFGCASAERRPSSNPSPDTLVSIPELSAPVRIVTDTDGIPHIRAQSLGDLYVAWGYVTARERLWQLAHNRAAARGERWRWMGNRTLQSDGAAQLLELADFANRLWEREQSDPDVGPALRAYTAGVNAWIERCERGEAPWPVEFERLNARPERWSPEDSALLLWSFGVLLDLDLAELGERDDLTRYGKDGMAHRRRFESEHVYATIPDSAAGRLWGGSDVGSTAAGARAAHAGPDVRISPAGAAAWARPLDALRAAFGRTDDEGRASNVFAVGPVRSASGAPLLANDIHLGLTVPSPLMLVHVSVPGVVNAAGAFPPGLPAIVSGRNATCAWGITSLAADMLDVFADSISADGRRVLGPDGRWHAVQKKDFDMRYRLLGIPFPPFGQVRRYGPHGPILVWDTQARVAYGLRWTALSDSATLTRLVGMERSTSAAELDMRWQPLVTPGINVVAADLEGHVHYRAAGAVPIRSADPGRGPAAGDGGFEWKGASTPRDMPAWRVPADGFVVNANNLPAGPPYPILLPRYDWAQDRAIRIDERLASMPRATAATLRTIQGDAFSRRAGRFLPAFMACADSMPDKLTPVMRQALDTLRTWNLEAVPTSTAPTLLWAWHGAYLRRSDFGGVPGLALAALQGRAPDALRHPVTGEPERPAAAAIAALDTALAELETRLGPDVGNWSYARAHQARFAHPLAVRGRNGDLTPEPVAVGGDGGTPLAGRSRLPWRIDVTHAPVLRHVVDLAIADSSWVIVAPGNSGDVRGPHATDHLQRWSRMEYAVLHTAWDRIEARPGRITRLEP